MPVLVEAISVIVRHDSIEAKVAGGFKAFTDLCRAETTTLCSDGELARVGFGATDAARRFVEKLGFLGLVHLSKGSATDVVMADQRSGLLQPCAWAEFAVVDLPGSPPPRVAACRLKGGNVSGLTVPDGWRYDSSVSREAGVIPKRDAKTLAVYAGRPGGAAPIAQRLGLKPVKG